ncbi:hypothetical protein TELCIR_06986 [Teladorsagia circumcincta]|uniref:AMP-dependent synthetase/ligase domain-containing protein n=1 Tax=Teladorsagia circumcincta TaxID=45464 RepID=A0A2G9ULI0_TELCI|nr:hypothetical protein TELCIR_06986 [Teladorsagia circumcincta]
MPNHWVWAPFFLGVAMNGGTLTGFNPASTEYELKHLFVDSQSKVVLTDKESLQKVLDASCDSRYMKFSSLTKRRFKICDDFASL